MIKLSFLQKGFTLVELLIVISVIGILASIILVAINPGEQMAKSRDAGRRNIIAQLGRAELAYYSNMGSVSQEGNNWMYHLKTAGELKSIPARIGTADAPGNITECHPDATHWSNAGNYNQSGFCYYLNGTGTEGVIVTRLESSSDKSKCASGLTPYFIWYSINARTCLVCTNIATGISITSPSCNSTQ